jgi:REP-associated tyrosine transposase
MGVLADELNKHNGTCSGFVIMPDHVHAILWFGETERLSPFMRVWKSRSSRQLKKFVLGQLDRYAKTIDPKEPFWQPKYYPFNLYSQKKALQKLDYMHLNPVRAGLVEQAIDWLWSSARYYEQGKSVAVPIKWVF